MANLRRRPGGPYHIEFRYAGHKFQRSLGTKQKKEADRLSGVVEQTASYIDLGVLKFPPRSTTDDLWRFLVSGGKITPEEQPTLVESTSIEEATQEYLDSYAEGAKEKDTLQTERTHLSHFVRLIGKKKQIDSIEPKTIEAYIKRRQQEPGLRGNKVSATTIGKELATFGLFWKFALGRGWSSGDNPAISVSKPRASQKLPFMTIEEIQKRISRGGLTDADIAELWDALFLREGEIGEVLRDLKESCSILPHAAYVYPAISFCAYTGARRSEMFRTLIDDVNGRVLLREKKRSQDHTITFREVPLHQDLKVILEAWLENHPGGQYLFCRKAGKPLQGKTSQDGMKAALRKSEWKVLRGYHVFRHSFASNLARHGTDQRIIDSWMGHQTEEMRQRYRHLFPEDTKQALSVLNFKVA